MKRKLSLLVIISLFLMGCASLKPKQVIEDNTFYCSYPEIKIKVSPTFKYLGDVKYDKARDSVDSSRSLRYDVHSYIFIEQNATKPHIKKLLQIQTRRVETHYISDFWRNVKYKLEHGVQKLGGENYQYYTKVIYPSMKGGVTKHLFDQGYILPICVLGKQFGKVKGIKGSFLITITYIKDISDVGYSCSAWRDKEKLTEEQKQYIEKFNKDFMELFEVLN